MTPSVDNIVNEASICIDNIVVMREDKFIYCYDMKTKKSITFFIRNNELRIWASVLEDSKRKSEILHIIASHKERLLGDRNTGVNTGVFS